MKIYIAGPMTGLPEHNYPAFHAAAAAWREAGWEVANPAENFGGDQTRTYPEYVKADVKTLRGCDAIAMLPGWDAGHSGAIWEYEIAQQIFGMQVYDATRPQPPHTLPPSIGEWIDQVVPPPTDARKPWVLGWTRRTVDGQR